MEHFGVKLVISIHALREEGDPPCARRLPSNRNFYPRPPRGGRPAHTAAGTASHRNFYPRPPRGGRPRPQGRRPADQPISIHALREEGDAGAKPQRSVNYISIHALREEGDPSSRNTGRLPHKISIHALREEGDARNFKLFLGCLDFYPRPPRGGRRNDMDTLLSTLAFLSTPSARRATRKLAVLLPYDVFLSTPSARRATFGTYLLHPSTVISIHALREEGDLKSVIIPPSHLSFLSTPSARRATFCPRRDEAGQKDFYPRPPRGGRHTRYLHAAIAQ